MTAGAILVGNVWFFVFVNTFLVLLLVNYLKNNRLPFIARETTCPAVKKNV
jgi:hypothetical protein